MGLLAVLFRLWLYRRPRAFAAVETAFWFACVLFTGWILLALLLSALLPAPPRTP